MRGHWNEFLKKEKRGRGGGLSVFLRTMVYACKSVSGCVFLCVRRAYK